MNKQILGKMYNTETAESLGVFVGGRGDTRERVEFYRTNRGDFFLHGKGGVNTRWNKKEDIIAIEGATVNHWKGKINK